MTIKLGPMELLATEPLDGIEDYVNGLQPDGGEWTNWSRLSGHDHSGGLLGAPVTAVIPPGSITAGQLDPSVLAPYALTDGSKPFTGPVTMQADAIIRDALHFGEQGTALAPDATLSRTGAGALRVDTHLGVGVNPSAWEASWRTVGVGAMGSLAGHTSYQATALTHNARLATDGHWTYLTNNQAQQITMTDGGIKFATAPAGTGWVTAFDTPKAVIAPTGTLTLSPDGGASALVANVAGGGQLFVADGILSGGAARLYASHHLELQPAGGMVLPGAANSYALGAAGTPWSVVYATNGTIQPSSAAVKQAIAPLDPGEAMAAVRTTEPVTFTYTAPPPPPASQQRYRRPPPVRFDWKRERDAQIARPLMAAARQQAGFVAEQAAPLFLTGEGQANASNTAGVLLAALKDVDTRLTALEEGTA